MVKGGTSLVTNAPAATIAPLPIRLPGKIIARVTIQTSSSTMIGWSPRSFCACLGTSNLSKEWFCGMKTMSGAIITLSPFSKVPSRDTLSTGRP
jgi:hypothetical protein